MPEVFFKRTTLPEALKNHQIIPLLLDAAQFSKGIRKNDFLGLKIHFGEQGNTSYIAPSLLRPLVQYLKKAKVKPFFFDTNTLYRGQRMNAVDHLLLASQHRFGSLGIPIMIGDGLTGNDYFEVEINKKHYTRCYIASLLKDVDYLVCLSHFTMHMLTGFGASIKNLGMGLASRRGKLAQHCEMAPRIDPRRCISCGLCVQNCPAQCINKGAQAFEIASEHCIGCAQCISTCPHGAVTISWSDKFALLQERMVEYAYASIQNKKCAYFNFCLFMTKECDCMNREKSAFIDDLGVLFSYDPVALDKASVDLIIARENQDVMRQVHPAVEYAPQFDYAQTIGLGSTEYQLIEL